jgi:4-alpha-glucanotransferase
VGRSASLDALFDHAAALGVETGYWDIAGHWHDASPDALLAVLAALGAPVDPIAAGRSDGALRTQVDALGRYVVSVATVPIPPVVTALVGRPAVVELCLPDGVAPARVRIEVDLEDGTRPMSDHRTLELREVGAFEAGGRRWVRRALPVGSGRGRASFDNLPIGYHSVAVEHGGQRHTTELLVAPAHVRQPSTAERLWGVFAPLYALRADRGLGPNLGDLDELATWLNRHGGKILATLPLLASSLDRPPGPAAGRPPDTSPYSPVSRRFWNELYLDLEQLPELAAWPRAREWLERPETVAEVTRLREAPRFEPAGQAALMADLLDELTAVFFARSAVGSPGFDHWIDAHPQVVDYGRFRAVSDRMGVGWREWPERLRAGRIESADYDVRVAARHVYAQWSMDRQLAGLSRRLEARGQHLYLDLPVGSAADGFDTWIDRHAYGWGASVGAPPDDFFAAGQNWGFPPLRPASGRDEGHRHLAEALRHHMTHAGMVRLDHVMGMHRLFWVPQGMEPHEGVYVRYPADEQFAVVAIESQRAGCIVVGEDLGTVPDEVRVAMDRHRVLRSYVAEFSLPGASDESFTSPDRRMVAAVDTHDTPTFAAFLSGADLRARRDEGRLTAVEADVALAERGRVRDRLVDTLRERGLLATGDGQQAASVLRGLLELLADSEAPALIVGLDDLVGEHEPQNVPGTGPDRPNWVLRLPVSLAELMVDPAVNALLDAVQARRLASHDRGLGA